MHHLVDPCDSTDTVAACEGPDSDLDDCFVPFKRFVFFLSIYFNHLDRTPPNFLVLDVFVEACEGRIQMVAPLHPLT